MLVYGEGGVGKSTFASTGPTPLMADCENGSKYFGIRGIKMDVTPIKTWSDMIELKKALISGELSKYETIVIDPIGEAMDKLKQALVATGNSKWVQKSDDSLTMAGWGELKKKMKEYIKLLRDSGKHVILIGHVEEKDDEGVLVKRPMIETKIATDIRNIVDIVGYMFTRIDPETGKENRIIAIENSSRYWAKDRTGLLGKFIRPDFQKIIDKLSTFEWKKEEVVPEKNEVVPEKEVEVEKLEVVEKAKEKLQAQKIKKDGNNNREEDSL